MKMMAPKTRSLSWCGSVVVALAALSWCGCATTAAAAAATTARQMGPLCKVAPLPDWDRNTIMHAGGIYVVDLNTDGQLAAVVENMWNMNEDGKVMAPFPYPFGGELAIMDYQHPRPVAADAVVHLKPSQEKTQAILKALQTWRTAGGMVKDLGGGWFGPLAVAPPEIHRNDLRGARLVQTGSGPKIAVINPHHATYLLKLAEGRDAKANAPDPPAMAPACLRFPSESRPGRSPVGPRPTVAPPQQEQAASTGTNLLQQRFAPYLVPVTQSSAAAEDEAGTPPPAAKIFGNQKFLVDVQDAEMGDGGSAGSTSEDGRSSMTSEQRQGGPDDRSHPNHALWNGILNEPWGSAGPTSEDGRSSMTSEQRQGGPDDRSHPNHALWDEIVNEPWGSAGPTSEDGRSSMTSEQRQGGPDHSLPNYALWDEIVNEPWANGDQEMEHFLGRRRNIFWGREPMDRF